MIKFDVLNRFSGEIQFTAKIDCSKSELNSLKLGLAVKWAIKNSANLSDANLGGAALGGANLGGANLGGANLRGANLRGAANINNIIIDGGLRSDGYRFLLTRRKKGGWRVEAGCRDFTVADAKKHWDETRPKGQPLGDETRLIIKHMLALAKLRNWPKQGEVAPHEIEVA